MFKRNRSKTYAVLELNDFVDTKKYDCNIKVNKTIRICHSPTNRYYKGSEYIIPACKQIELENENVEFVLIEDKTQKEMSIFLFV